MTIPEIRAALMELANKLVTDLGLLALNHANELRRLAQATTRRAPVRRSPSRYPRLTEEQIREIRAYALAHPSEPYTVIARRFNTGPGRVSEAVAGMRT